MIETTLPELLLVVKKLRSEEGCPWDKIQTHQSLIPFLEEESAEVIDAIHDGNLNEVKEELADLLFQVLLHSEIAEESGAFNFNDVMSILQEKIIRRHPHVFSGKKYDSIAEQKEDWQRIKAEERRTKGMPEGRSLLAGIPSALPALKQASLLQEKAATVGFDWDDIADVWDKVEEEKAELLEAVEMGNPSEIESELGDLLFSLVNYARFLNIDATKALNSTNRKFRQRFQYIEDHAKRELQSLSLEELDQYWNDAKKAGR
ncbi:nucleoside triphosphate pyrophosphohydrolase [Ignatzschineria sp. LJL83]